MAFKRPFYGEQKEGKRFHPYSDSNSINLQSSFNEKDDINDFFDNDECDNICSQLEFPLPDPLSSVKLLTKSSYTCSKKDSNMDIDGISANDTTRGEILTLKQEIYRLHECLKKEKENNLKVFKEQSVFIDELKEEYERKLRNIKAQLEFKEKENFDLKMKINELEKILKKTRNEKELSHKPLYYSYPITMHRLFNFSEENEIVDSKCG